MFERGYERCRERVPRDGERGESERGRGERGEGREERREIATICLISFGLSPAPEKSSVSIEH